MECYCHLRHVHDKMADGKTVHENKFGVTFDGHLVSFGANVSYKHVSSKDESLRHQFGIKMLPGISMGNGYDRPTQPNNKTHSMNHAGDTHPMKMGVLSRRVSLKLNSSFHFSDVMKQLK